MLNARGQFVHRAIESVIGASAHRVDDGPMDAWHPGRQLLVGVVADRDDQVVVRQDVVKPSRSLWPHRQVVTPCSGDRPGMNAFCGMRTRRRRPHRTAAVPDGRGELTACGVLSAHEHHPARPAPSSGHHRLKRTVVETEIGTAPVGFGSGASDQTGILEHTQVVSHKVRRHGQRRLQFAGRCISHQ